MAFSEYGNYDALGLAKLVAARKISPRDVIDEAIARAERLNPKLNAIVFQAFDRARDAARGKLPKGPFAGVPTLLKDMRAGAIGMPTRSGSRFSPDTPADHDATLVARYRAAGLVLLGKTNVPEFGIVATTEPKLYGACRNPWNTDYSVGGSSGGSACSVAAGIVPIAHATDGGGSIRIPAACCGLVGLKVSRGRTTVGPDVGDSLAGFSVDHVVTRSVRDSALALDVGCPVDFGDPYFALPPSGSYLEGIKRKPKRLRIAVTTTRLDGSPVHADCAAAVKKAAKLCESLGHHVEEKTPPVDNASLIQFFLTIWAVGTAAGVAAITLFTGRTPSLENLEGLTWGLYEKGRATSAAQYVIALQMLYRIGRMMARFHETYDVWLTPTLGMPPVKNGTFDLDTTDMDKGFGPMTDYVAYTAIQNATGQPAINLPLHWNKEGLPVGVQFVGRAGDEMTLLKLAAELEKAQPWAHRYPKL